MAIDAGAAPGQLTAIEHTDVPTTMDGGQHVGSD
jgi:hypothetical protein